MGHSFSDGGSSGSEEELFAALENELGPVAEAVLRQAQRSGKLTDAERAQLWVNLTPVLRDLRLSGAIMPEVREEETWDCDPGSVSAWIELPGISGMGIRVRFELDPAERLADLADQVQEWEVNELAARGRSPAWPQCPWHPGSHPLSPRARDGAAVWCCPVSGLVFCPIGTLG